MSSVEFRDESFPRRPRTADPTQRQSPEGTGEPEVVEAADLTIAVQATPDSCALALRGDLDLASVRALEEEVHRAERLAGHGTLIVDLSGLTSIDTHGLGAVLDLSQRAKRGTWTLAVLRPSPGSRGLLRLLPRWNEIPFVGPGEL